MSSSLLPAKRKLKLTTLKKPAHSPWLREDKTLYNVLAYMGQANVFTSTTYNHCLLLFVTGKMEIKANST
jgi:hypothetical protein